MHETDSNQLNMMSPFSFRGSTNLVVVETSEIWQKIEKSFPKGRMALSLNLIVLSLARLIKIS